MEIAQLILEYVKALAWPAVVVVGAVLFRQAIRSLVARIVRAKGFGAELELAAEKVAEASEALPVIGLAQDQETNQSDGQAVAERAAEVAETQEAADTREEVAADVEEVRRGAANLGRFLQAWTSLEVESLRTGDLLGLNPRVGRNIRMVCGALEERGVVGRGWVEVARDLQDIRNQIIHSAEAVDLSNRFVADFEETTTKMTTVLRQARTWVRSQNRKLADETHAGEQVSSTVPES